MLNRSNTFCSCGASYPPTIFTTINVYNIKIILNVKQWNSEKIGVIFHTIKSTLNLVSITMHHQ